jgi:hypothetical protein
LLRIHGGYGALLAISVSRLLLVGGLLLIAAALHRPVAEQEFDEAATHLRTFGVGGADRRRRRGLIGVNHGGFCERRGVNRQSLIDEARATHKAGRAREERKGGFSEHRRTLYCFVTASRRRRLRRGRCTWSIKGQNHLSLVNRNGVSIHHVTGLRADLSGSVNFG